MDDGTGVSAPAVGSAGGINGVGAPVGNEGSDGAYVVGKGVVTLVGEVLGTSLPIYVGAFVGVTVMKVGDAVGVPVMNVGEFVGADEFNMLGIDEFVGMLVIDGTNEIVGACEMVGLKVGTSVVG